MNFLTRVAPNDSKLIAEEISLHAVASLLRRFEDKDMPRQRENTLYLLDVHIYINFRMLPFFY